MQGELSAVAEPHRGVHRLPRSGLGLAVAICGFLIAAASASAVSGQAYRDNSRAAHEGNLLAIAQPRYHAIVLFDARDAVPRPVFAFGRYGRQAGELIRPTGVALDTGRGLIYVSDTDNDRIAVFHMETDAVGQVREVSFTKAIGRSGSQPGELVQPAGLALDRQRQLYVCDTGNARIQVFDDKLVFARQWGTAGTGPGQLATPSSIALDESGVTVYVSDIGGLQVQTFDRTGKFLSAWGAPRDPAKGVTAGELAFPFSIAVANGFTYVSDSRRQDIQKFRGATLVKAWGGPGNENGRFFQPEGVAVIDAARVLVIDQGGHRGQIFSPDGTFISTFPIPAGDLYPWATPTTR